MTYSDYIKMGQADYRARTAVINLKAANNIGVKQPLKDRDKSFKFLGGARPGTTPMRTPSLERTSKPTWSAPAAIQLLPRGRVAWGASAKAAIPAVLLWEAGRLVFGGLLLQSPLYGLLTGTLAGIVTLLVWIYVAVALALYGAEVAALLNGNRSRRAPPAEDPYEP